MSVNKVFLNGRLGNDAEIRTIQSGRVASITVATDEGWKDRESGAWNERTEWHRVVSFQPGRWQGFVRYPHTGALDAGAGLGGRA